MTIEKPASAGQELADRIALSLNDARYEPGAVVGSEQDLREQHGASRSVFRQAMRLLE
ncbi:MAG: GntR family transcriptional regulator, partial [Rhizorhabdus sp.]|nr:GntR family transcriptional regulator [Rhizorhabdus sp.]